MPLEILADGAQKGRGRLQRIPPFWPGFFTNATGRALVEGDVVAVSLTLPATVEVYDVYRSARQYVVATSNIAAGDVGAFAIRGLCNVKVYLADNPFSPGSVTLTPGAALAKDSALGVDGQGVYGACCPIQSGGGGLVIPADGVTRPRDALGYSVATTVAAPTYPSPAVAVVIPCMWSGQPEFALNPADLCMFEEFLGLDWPGGTTTGAAAAGVPYFPPVRSSYPWWWAGQDPTIDQPNFGGGVAVVQGDGTATGLAYLLRDTTSNIGAAAAPRPLLAWSARSQRDITLRARLARRGTTAATVRFGFMSAFAAAAPANGIYLEQTLVSNPIITTVSSVGPSTIQLDTGVSIATGQMFDLELRIRGGWGSGFRTVTVLINGVYCGEMSESKGLASLPAEATLLGLGATSGAALATATGYTIDRIQVLADR